MSSVFWTRAWLLVLSVGMAIAMLLLPDLFTAVLLLYLGTTTAYSFALKRVAILDVLVLAGLYTLRVLAGAVATHIPVSPCSWLSPCSSS